MKSQGRIPLLTVPRAALVLCVLAIVTTSLFLSPVAPAHAASYCQVTYSVNQQWSGGFGATIAIQNTGTSDWPSWTLTWMFPDSSQTITQGWNGLWRQDGQNVSVTNASYNGSVPAGQAVAVSSEPGFYGAFNGAWDSSNLVNMVLPTSFSINGNVCDSASYFTTPGYCHIGYVWRDAGADDHICVSPETRTQAAYDNSQRSNRVDPNGGPYGPDTCLQGYVWRDAFSNDHVCVSPATRAQAAYDNSQAYDRTYH